MLNHGWEEARNLDVDFVVTGELCLRNVLEVILHLHLLKQLLLLTSSLLLFFGAGEISVEKDSTEKKSSLDI